MTDPTEPSARWARLYRTHRAPVACRVDRSANALRIVADELEIELPLEGLRCRQDGFDHTALFLSHASRPDHELLLDPATLASIEGLSGHPAVVAARGRTGFQVRRFWGCLLVLGLLVALLGGLAVVLTPRFVDWVVERIPWELERELGAGLVGQLESRPEWIDADDPLTALAAIALPLSAAREADPERTEVRLHLMDGEGINAFALPGGHIVVHRALVQAVERPEELLGVLAHEMAHVDLRHSLRSVVRQLGLVAAARFLFGDASGVRRLGGQGAAELLRLGFSRELEREADELGLEYLEEARIDPGGLVRFLGRLEEDSSGPRRPAFLETHPSPETRAERFRQGAGRPGAAVALEAESLRRLQTSLDGSPGPR